MDLPQILGRNVRERRKQLGLSQEQLALEAEMKRNYVSDLERGTRGLSNRRQVVDLTSEIVRGQCLDYAPPIVLAAAAGTVTTRSPQRQLAADDDS